MLRLGGVVLNVSDVGRSAEFWRAALDYSNEGRSELLRPPGDSPAPIILLDEDDRTHLDLWVDSAAESDAEVERLLSLGAERVEWTYPPDADFVVLADPGGTLFCVVNTAR